MSDLKPKRDLSSEDVDAIFKFHGGVFTRAEIRAALKRRHADRTQYADVVNDVLNRLKK